MRCGDNMLPRQRQLTIWIVVVFIVQVAVEAWTIPKSQTGFKLPLDFPLLKPFYRVIVLPEITDTAQNGQVEFHARKPRAHIQADGETTFFRKQIIDIDRKNGSIWLIRRPSDMEIFKNASLGKKQLRFLANITIIAQANPKVPSKKVEIFLEFFGNMSSFCEPSQAACFSSSNGKYRLSEGSVSGVVFDYLQNLRFPALCSNVKIGYNLTSDYNIIEINQATGELMLSKQPDAEEISSFLFKATCSIENQTYSMTGSMEIEDINDNSPTTQSGNTTANLIHYIKPGQNFLSLDVNVVDKDSTDVNDLVVRIEDDTLHLFHAKDPKIYSLLGSGKNTFLNAEIKSQTFLSFPEREYNFTIVIEDTSLQQEDRMVIYKVFLINETETELILKDMYEANISRNAAQYARIIQFSGSPLGYTFRFSIGEKHFDWIGITRSTGIVYVRDPHLIPNLSVVRKRIIWNETQNRSGNILLVLTIKDDESTPCESGFKWCSYNSNRNSCLSTCGKGSDNGHCDWMNGPVASTGPRPDYATCSPDLKSCPDGQCDELEQMDPTLCPQDCARKFTGEVVVSKSGQGLHAAVGPCYCPAIDRCTCVRNYPPAEMRRHKNPDSNSRYSTVLPIFEIYNETLTDQGKLVIETEETSTSIELVSGLLTDVTCGPGCIVFATIIPMGLLLVIVILVVTRRMRTSRISKHKFVSSHISLSGVPSDYVEERSNSAQESRNTPSETSSFGKSSTDTKWEFPRSRLQLQSVLGEGEFGKVMKAQAWNIAGAKGYTTVAVKMLKENGGALEKQDLLMEFMLLKEISHPNVVKLLGASTEKSGPFYLIVEYAEMGSLRLYLRKRRRHHNCCKYNATYGIAPNTTETPRDYYQYPCERSRYEPHHSYFHKEQLSFAWQIAKGMAYLSDMKLVHRDLAARNVLLAKRKVVKISDFGLSRDIYEGDAYLKKSKGRVPVKWMAIESLEDQIYTSRSDVWSFGVVVWEIMMQGATPYPGITPQRLYNLLKAGYRMSKPDFCSDEVYYLMRQCWRTLPRERPSFKELVLKLDFLLQDTVEYMDFVSKERLQRDHSHAISSTPNDPTPTIQYTSVLLENDEDEVSDQESNENIGLVRLFDQQEDNSRTQLIYSNPEESAA